jgi:hypothetical protein
MKDETIIANWIIKQQGFYMGFNETRCPCCNKLSRNMHTKLSNFCMPCFIFQVVNACKKGGQP